MKKAVVLLNLGGPNKRSEIKGFLYNLFSDKNIITVPSPFRQLIAFLISTSRRKKATEVYDQIGGFSPILENTQNQQNALKTILGEGFDIFIAMRYSYPRMNDIIRNLETDKYSEVILLPLYPQYSTTTSKSSIEEFYKYASKALASKTKNICCYFDDEKFINATAAILEEKLNKYQDNFENITILFSAHGLPKKIVEQGDPYRMQVEKCTELVMQKLNKKIDHIVCYQSRVGPLEWIKPYTEDVIIEKSKENKTIVLVPIAFVSEHSETLVELDMEYNHLAMENGAKGYERVPAQAVNDAFIKSLAEIVIKAGKNDSKFYPKRKCEQKYCGCINQD